MKFDGKSMGRGGEHSQEQCRRL